METNLIAGLLPAAAAGFAVQRLLEILDPVVIRIAGDEKKRIFLGFLSLIAGIGLALSGKLRVLSNLGADIPAVLDYIVTGLVVSAGTDGINSILKFLNYKKEEQKQEAVALGIDTNSAVALFKRRLAMTSNELGFTTATGDLMGDLDNSLKDQIRSRFPTKFKEEGFGDRAFDAYVTAMELFKVQDAVVVASDNVAAAYKVQLTEDARRRLQNKVALKTTPKKIVPEMEAEIAAADPVEA